MTDQAYIQVLKVSICHDSDIDETRQRRARQTSGLFDVCRWSDVPSLVPDPPFPGPVPGQNSEDAVAAVQCQSLLSLRHFEVRPFQTFIIISPNTDFNITNIKLHCSVFPNLKSALSFKS